MVCIFVSVCLIRDFHFPLILFIYSDKMSKSSSWYIAHRLAFSTQYIKLCRQLNDRSSLALGHFKMNDFRPPFSITFTSPVMPCPSGLKLKEEGHMEGCC